MGGKQTPSQKAWATIRERYPKGELSRRAWKTIREKYPPGELARRAYETRRHNQIMQMTDEEYEDYILQQMDREYVTAEHKRIRDLIRQAGGINDHDYEDIPTWCKRKDGQPLDVLVSELAGDGVPITCANDLYQLLQEVSP